MKKKLFSYSLVVTAGLLAFGVTTLSSCSSSATSFRSAVVRLNKNQLEMTVGDAEQLIASVSKGYNAELRWFTSNENVAYVNDGYVFAVGEGVAVVTAAYGGGFDDCTVVVSGTGGGSDPDVALNLSNTSKKLVKGNSFELSVTKLLPEGTTVTFSSENEAVATVEASEKKATITAVEVGTTVIKVEGSNGRTATCNITVTEESGGGSGGGESEDLDIAVDKNLGYSGTLNIGSPLIQRTFNESLLADFNRLTNSNITFEITQFEEDNGTAGYGKANSMPAVFPYASDQTLTLFQFGALSSVSKTDYTWIKNEMGDAAYKAARLTSVVGYPFAADNGVVMFYNKSVVSDPSEISTLDKLFALADEKDMEVNYTIGNAFYAAGALMTYAGGESLYSLSPTNTSYTSSSNFAGDAGLKAAKLIKKITLEGSLRPATGAPKGDVLATITDVSKVQNFKSQLGDNYAVAPLPTVGKYMSDTEDNTRLGSYLGYKFFGVNNTLSESDKKMASAVAKFLCSEYAQSKRLESFYTRPTLTKLAAEASKVPHIAALEEQSKNGGTIPLTAISSELWSQAGSAVTSIVALSPSASDAEFKSILELLDSQLTKLE